MSLLIRLDKLNKDLTLSNEEKYNVFQELLHSFLVKSKFNDFKTLLNYYQFKQETIYECLTNCINQDKITFVKHITYSYNKASNEGNGIYNIIPIRKEDIKCSILNTKIDILKYFLSQCSKTIVTNDLLFSTNNKNVLQLLIQYGIDPEPKLDIIIQKCAIMNKMSQCIETWCSRGDIHTLTYFMSYFENYINLCCSTRKTENNSLKVLQSVKESLEKIIKKEYSYKSIFLQNFQRFLEENNENDIARINGLLMSI
jgi:hypothetical protein